MADLARHRARGQIKANKDTAHEAAASTTTTATAPTKPLRASSSFFSVPSVIFTGVSILPPWSGIPGRHIYNYTRKRLGWHSAAHALVRVILTTTNESLLANAWDVLQATVFQHSTASAIPYFIVAVVLNHARRTLWFGIPIVGFFTRPQPDEDWRLLLARPDVFLEDLVKSVCSGYFVSLTQKRVWDILAGGLTGVFLLSDNDRPQSRIARTIHRRAKDITATLFLVWLASCIEYAVAQASTTLAIGMAVWKMTRSGQSELLFRIMFDGSFITTAWLLVFVWRQMVVYPWTGLVPMVIRSVSRPVPQPGVMLCLVFSVLTMDTLLRYRSRLYIAIETSGFFVFMGYAILSSMVLAADWRVKRDQRKQKNI